MRIEKLELKHKSLLIKHFCRIQTELSEYSFSNLYLFQEKHQYCLLTTENGFFITGITYDGCSYIMPITDLKREVSLEYLQELKKQLEHYDMIFPIPEEWLDLFPEECFSVTYNRNDSDYIYNIEKLARFPGRKLHGKRNLLSQFLRNYKADFKIFGPENRGEMEEILRRWQAETQLSEEETDFFACMKAIRHLEELGLCGTIFMADGESVGFLIGEEICDTTYGIHFAKGWKEIKGLYQYMFSKCSENYSQQYQCINMEQDMGKESLRVSKNSYLPDRLVKKYRIQKKKQQTDAPFIEGINSSIS